VNREPSHVSPFSTNDANLGGSKVLSSQGGLDDRVRQAAVAAQCDDTIRYDTIHARGGSWRLHIPLSLRAIASAARTHERRPPVRRARSRRTLGSNTTAYDVRVVNEENQTVQCRFPGNSQRLRTLIQANIRTRPARPARAAGSPRSTAAAAIVAALTATLLLSEAGT
jgi:hypothetical protein